MKFRPVSLFLLAIAVIPSAHSGAQVASVPPKMPAGQAPSTIVYRNAKYGFCFVLPASWKGYTIISEQWRGSDFNTHQDVHGPQLRIRHPGWTRENPYEDIPIMVFTPMEWQKVVAVTISVSAAPFGPEELGHNSRYVFALPPRWIGFNNDIGWQEIEVWMEQNRLQVPCAPVANHS